MGGGESSGTADDGGEDGPSAEAASSVEDASEASADATTSTDGTAPSDGSVQPDGDISDAADASDALADSSVDGGTGPIACTAGFLNGKPMPPRGGDSAYCKGGCDWPGGPLSPEHFDYSNICHATCTGSCSPDPRYAGVCPAECPGGCADGVYNIACDGSDPALSCAQVVSNFKVTKPVVKCPEGLPCKVTCSNGGCNWNILACPRGDASCDIEYGSSCAGAHLYCGAGRCNLHGTLSGTAAGGKDRSRNTISRTMSAARPARAAFRTPLCSTART